MIAPLCPLRALHGPGALALSLLAAACSSAPPGDDAQPHLVPAVTSSATASARPQLSPDAILQERLRAAVRDLHGIEGARRPVSYGSIGLLNGTPPSAAPPPPVPVPAPAPAPASKLPPTDPSGPWPIVAIEGKNVLVDGALVGDLGPILEAQRVNKVGGVFDALKKARADWKAAHPNMPFPGVAGLRSAAETPLVALKSVYQTMAFAGWPEILVQSAAEPTAIFELAAQVPGPPDLTMTDAPTEPEPHLRVGVEAGEIALVWKKGADVISEQKVPVGAPDLAAKLCASWKAQGAHRAPEDRYLDPLIVGGDNRLPFGAIAPILLAAEACTREQHLPGDAPRTVPVFWITFTLG